MYVREEIRSVVGTPLHMITIEVKCLLLKYIELVPEVDDSTPFDLNLGPDSFRFPVQ